MADVKINRKLRLVVPVETAEGAAAFIHTTPISREVYETHFLVMAETFAAIYQRGLSITSGPRVAAMLLKKIAQNSGIWDGPGGVRDGLVAEIYRLSNVMLPSPGGWQTVPLSTALSQNLLDEDSAAEAEGVITFFILNSAIQGRTRLPTVLAAIAGLWSARTTLSDVTEYANSLPTSKLEETTGARTPGSSVPS